MLPFLRQRWRQAKTLTAQWVMCRICSSTHGMGIALSSPQTCLSATLLTRWLSLIHVTSASSCAVRQAMQFGGLSPAGCSAACGVDGGHAHICIDWEAGQISGLRRRATFVSTTGCRPFVQSIHL
jgi:hypothetical protein